jgi:opacity protein-like surface antigen
LPPLGNYKIVTTVAGNWDGDNCPTTLGQTDNMRHIIATLLACFAFVEIGDAQALDKLTFEGSIGPSFPIGSAQSSMNTGYNFLFGAGWKFTPSVAGFLEFQYDRASLTNQTLQAFGQADGFNRFWSLTLNPRYYIHPKGKISGYGTAGYGLYARSLAFTDPSQAVGYCDPFYGYCESSGAPVVAEFTNYKGGFNVGGGLTYAIGASGFKFVTDVRYNRFLSHANNEFVTLTFGILF